MEKLILLVEDNQEVQKHNKRMFEVNGYTVKTALNLAAAREALDTEAPVSAIILDIGMPDGNGLDFLRALRQTSKIPVLLLTGYGEDKDIVLGFEAGCDDYLPKPYTFAVLLARLERLLKSAEQIPDALTKGRLTLKTTSMVALVDGEDILLTQKEFALLQLFVQHENRCLSPEYVYEQVWGQPTADDVRTVKFHISRLRKKIENSGYTIVFKSDGGYWFERE